MKTLIQWLKIAMRQYWPLVCFITRIINNLYKPIYYYHFSRDCDMCERSYVDKFQGSRKAYETYKNMCYEGAEGPMSFEEINKSEYEESKGITHTRDRILEAYENGNGNSIYV